MKSGFTLLRKTVCNNKLAEAFFNQVSDRERPDPELSFDRVLSQRIATYEMTVEGGDGEENQDRRLRTLKQLVDTVPSFLFRLVDDWNQAGGDPESGRSLALGILSSLIWKDPGVQPHIEAFIADIDPTADIKQLNTQLIQKTDRRTPVPKKVFIDFLAMMKPVFPPLERDGLPQRIETLFYFESLFQFLLTYYLDLLSHSETETVTGYVHIIFLRLFAALKQQEQGFWESTPEKSALRQILLDVVAEDSPEKRHPLLRRTAFKAIQLYNPLFNPLTKSCSVELVRRYNQRLETFLSLCGMGMTLFLDTLRMIKGPGPVISIAERLFVDEPQKFSQLLSFLSEEKNRTHEAVRRLLQEIADRKPSREEGVPTGNVGGVKAEGALTQNRISAYLKQRLLALHDREKEAGALTQDQIRDYLASISGELADTLAKGRMDHAGVDSFVETVSPEIREITALGMLAQEEKDGVLKFLKGQARQFSETYKPQKTAEQKTTEAEIPVEAEAGAFIEQEIIPIGFETGAPRISKSVFFRFPFLGMDGQAEQPFDQHVRYLEKAVSEGALSEKRLAEIKSGLTELPKPAYRKTYDIFPLDRYDETVLLVVFSLWRNQVLDNLLLEPQQDR